MPVYKESAFPAEYRRAEAGRILGAVYRLRSIAVTGLAGMGKSSVMRFVVANGAAQALHLGDRAARWTPGPPAGAGPRIPQRGDDPERRLPAKRLGPSEAGQDGVPASAS